MPARVAAFVFDLGDLHEQLFWDKVDKYGPVPAHRPDLGRCWVWTAWTSRQGYGRAMLKKQNGKDRATAAHRVSFFLVGNKLDPELELDHLCRNRQCVNPFHLEQVTHQVNTLRSNNPLAKNGAKTHCFRGHELSGENLILRGKGRTCRECNNAWHRNYRKTYTKTEQFKQKTREYMGAYRAKRRLKMVRINLIYLLCQSSTPDDLEFAARELGCIDLRWLYGSLHLTCPDGVKGSMRSTHHRGLGINGPQWSWCPIDAAE